MTGAGSNEPFRLISFGGSKEIELGGSCHSQIQHFGMERVCMANLTAESFPANIFQGLVLRVSPLFGG